MAPLKHRELFDDMKKTAMEQVESMEGNFKSVSHSDCVSMVSEQRRFVNECVETQMINGGDTEEGTVDVETTACFDPDNFRIEVDVHQFTRKEVSVKVTGNYVTVEGKHEEKQGNSSAFRKFSKKFTVPDGYDVSGLTSTMSNKGILVIVAPKISIDKSKEIIVTQTERTALETKPEQLQQLEREFIGSSTSSIVSEKSYQSSSECFLKQETRSADKEESFVDVQSRVYTDKEHFSVEIYVQEFTSQEISITVSGDCVTVEGNHEEKQENRSLFKKFLRKYTVPQDYDVSALVPTFSSTKKLLTLTAPKISTKCQYCNKHILQTEQDLQESSSTKKISETHKSSNECSQTQINTIDNEKMDNVDIETTVRIDKDNFRIDLDVQQFTPQEISIKISGDCVTVQGNHEEKRENKFVYRRFTKKYRVPQGYDVRAIISTYSSSKKVLTLTIPRVSTIESKEFIIPITQTEFNTTNKQEVEEELKQSSVSVEETNRCLTECLQPQKPSTSNKSTVDIKSTVQTNEQTFHIELDVHEFTAEEISTKVIENCVIIEGNHEEKHENKSMSRKFVKNYTIPEVFDIKKLETTLSSKGIMTITAPKKVSKETLIPIAKPEVPIIMGQQKKEDIQECSSSSTVSQKSQFVNECYQTKSTNIIEKEEIKNVHMEQVQQNEQNFKSVSRNKSPPAVAESLRSVNESSQALKNTTVKEETEDVVVEHTLHLDTNHFSVSLNVEEFTPQEIAVKTSDDCIIIEGSHENQNSVSKKFLKKITVPQGFDVTAVDATFSKKGVLVLSAPRVSTDLNTLEEISHKSHHFTNECFKTKQTSSIDEESSTHIDQDQFRLELNLQQSTLQDISVKADEDYIIVEANHQSNQEKFHRKFKLPSGYDITAMSPTLSSDGLLTITIPKISANLSVSETSKKNLRDFDELKAREIKTESNTLSSKKTVEKESSFHIGEDFIRVDLDVQQFTPQEISIKVSGECIIIEANHEEKQGQTTTFKKFAREYTLPQGYDVNALVPTFSSDGVLSLAIPKTSTNVSTSSGESCLLTHHTQQKSIDREFTLRINKDSFRVDLDVHQFKLQNISVKVFDECITVEGKDDNQQTNKLFKKYTIPKGYDVSAVVPSFSPDGILTLAVPKASTDSHSEFSKQTHFLDKIFKAQTTKQTEDFTVHANNDSFSVNVDVQQYTAEEISIKVSGDCVTIEGIHKENQGNSSMSKKFLRTYTVPQGFDIAALSSSLSSNGILTLTAPKITKTIQEKIIPVARTGEAVNEDQN